MDRNIKSSGTAGVILFLREHFFDRPVTTLALAASVVVASAVGLILPLIQRELIDMLGRSPARHIACAALVIFGCGIVIRGCSAAETYLLGIIRSRGMKHLRNKVFVHILSLPLGVIGKLGGGYVSGRMMSDVENTAWLPGVWVSLCRSLIRIAAGWVVVLCFNWQAGLALLVVIPGYIAAVRFFSRSRRGLAARLSEHRARSHRTIYQTLRNFARVKQSGWEDDSVKDLQKSLRRQEHLELRRVRVDQKFFFTVSLIPGCCYLCLFVCGYFRYAAGVMTAGDIWALYGLMRYLFSPVQGLVNSVLHMQNGMAALERLAALEANAPESSGSRSVPEHFSGSIAFEKVDFSYPGAPELLRDFSCDFPAGSWTLISGASGCGKSTMASLIFRLYSPLSGRITMDGTDISEFELLAYRRRIGYLSNYNDLFAGTLYENLTYGLTETPPEEEFRRLLEETGVAEIAAAAPLGLDTPVWEGGENFSMGERIRISLARELLRGADVLILDEAAVNLDPENAERFFAVLKRCCGKDHTVIAISHLERTAAHFTRRIDLDKAALPEVSNE